MRWRPFRRPPPDAAAWWDAREATYAPGGPPLRRNDADEVTVEPPDPERAFARGRDALLAYRVYPEPMLLHRVCTPTGRVEAGCLIVQRVRVGPLALEAGVRVLDAWDEPGRVGYRYVTLRGHPERGVASFEARREGGRVAFRIASVSEPTLRLTAPYARHAQRRAVRAAMDGMRARLLGDA